MSASGKVFATLFLAPVVIVVAGIGGCEARKAYYDWQVRKMCDKDGGVVIHDRIKLSRAEFARLGGYMGEIPMPEERSALPNEPYVSSTEWTTLRVSNPTVWRIASDYKRRADGKVFARSISYLRVGGDFPSLSNSTSFTCPDRKALDAAIRGLFVIE